MNMIDIPTDYMFFVEEKNYVFYRPEKGKVKSYVTVKQNIPLRLYGY